SAPAEAADQLGPREDVTPAQPDTLRPTGLEVQLPLAPAGRQQGGGLLDIAHRLAVGLAGLASGEEYQHQPAAERGGEREPQDHPHGDVDHAHHPRLEAPAKRALLLSGHGWLLASVAPDRVLREPRVEAREGPPGLRARLRGQPWSPTSR